MLPKGFLTPTSLCWLPLVCPTGCGHEGTRTSYARANLFVLKFLEEMLTSGLEQYLILCSADIKCQDRLWIFVVSFKCLTCKNVQMQSGNDKRKIAK